MSEQMPPDGSRVPARTDRAASRPGVPRWVKTLGIVVAALLLIMLIVMISSGGQHGPGRHRPSLPGLAVLVATGMPLASGAP